MTSTGSPVEPLETDSAAPAPGDSQTQHKIAPWVVLVVAIAALLFALVVGGQIISVLYAMLNPPLPPLPDNAASLSHENIDYGVDTWEYATLDGAMDVMHFYQGKGGQCTTDVGADARGALMRCSATEPFSIFTVQWQVDILPSANAEGNTLLRVSREVFWIGTGKVKSDE